MGETRVTIEVGDPLGRWFASVPVMVDTGATFTSLPGPLLRELGVAVTRSALAQLADGSISVDDVGETVIRLEGVQFTTPVVFAGEGEPNLLGVVALETALLAVDPVGQRLVSREALKYYGAAG